MRAGGRGEGVPVCRGGGGDTSRCGRGRTGEGAGRGRAILKEVCSLGGRGGGVKGLSGVRIHR